MVTKVTDDIDLRRNLIDNTFDQFFLPFEDPILPYEGIFAAFEEAFFDYLVQDEQSFLSILESLGQKGHVDSDPNFLNLSFEELFEVPVEEGQGELFSATYSGELGLVNSVGNPLFIDGLGAAALVDSLERVVSVGRNLGIPEPGDFDLTSSITPVGGKPIDGTPSAPNFTVNISAQLLNFQPSVIGSYGIFTNSAKFGLDGPGYIYPGYDPAMFLNPYLQGEYSEVPRPYYENNEGFYVLTTPDGNTLTFYTIANEDDGYAYGDYFFTLTQAPSIATTPPEDMFMQGGTRYFINRFTYTVVDIDGDTATGFLIFIIEDAHPVATDQFHAPPLEESHIPFAGSQSDAVSDIADVAIGNLIHFPDNFIGVNGGSVSNVTIAGGTTIDGSQTITVIDSVGNVLLVQKDTGGYSFALLNPYQNVGNAPTVLSFVYTFTDNNGNSASATLFITANDDAPTAFVQTNSVDETDLFVNGTETATGNILNTVNDTQFGADGAGPDGGILSILGVSDAGDGLVDGIINVETAYGSLAVYVVVGGGYVVGDYIYTLDGAKTQLVLDSLGSVIDSIPYVLIDSDGSTAGSTLDITVDLNQAPVGVDDAVTLGENGVAVSTAPGFMSNDTDPDAGDTKTIVMLEGSSENVGFPNVFLTSGAHIYMEADGSYQYDPNNSFEYLAQGETATDTFTYQMADAEGLMSDPVTVTLTILGSNDPPVAVDDLGTANENTTASVDGGLSGVLGNDTDVDNGATLFVSRVEGSTANVGNVVTLTSGALLTLNMDGSYFYNPNGKFNFLSEGETTTDSFTYVTKDEHGAESGTATVTILITGINAPPTANEVVIGATEDGGAVNGAFSGDDEDSDDDPGSLIYTITSTLNPGEGSIVNNNDGTFTFDPGADFQELALGETKSLSISYIATDSHGADSAPDTISINVVGVNDAPIVNDVIVSAVEDGAGVTKLFGGDDIDSDNNQSDLTYTIIDPLGAGEGSVIDNGDGTFTYNPGADFQNLADGETKTVDFTYKATDIHGQDSGIATVTITVTGVNDAPVVNDVGIAAVEDGPTVLGAFSGDDVDSDDDSNSIIYSIVSPLNAGEGSVINNNDGTFTFDPGADFQNLNKGQTTTVDFTYKATDSHGLDSGVKTVTVTVTGINDAPIAVDDVNSTTEDAKLTVAAAGVLTNDTDVDSGSTRTVALVNGLAINVGTPILLGSGALLTLNANGSYTYDTNKAFGFLALGDSTNDSFTYVAVDENGAQSNTATVTITIAGENNPPVANDVAIAAVEDGATVNGAFSADDADSDDDPGTLVYSIVSNLTGGEGSVVNNNDGSFTFNPGTDFQSLNKGQTATVDFTYKATDSHGADSAVKTVTITVTGVNDAPIAVDDVNSTSEAGKLTVAAAGVLTNDTDVDSGSSRTVALVNGQSADVGKSIILTSGALLTLNANGSYTYDTNNVFGYLAQGDTTTESFTYVAVDENGAQSNPATVTITITGENAAPVANDVAIAAVEDGAAVNGAFSADDADSDDDPGTLIYSIVSNLGAGEGSVINNNDGTFSFNPGTDFQNLNLGQTATVDFTYKATDSHGADSATKTVTITVTGINDAPIANNDTGTINENSKLNVAAAGVLINDTDVDSGSSRTVSKVNGLIANVGSTITLTSGALLKLNANGSYDYDTNGKFEALAQGSSTTDTFKYIAVDEHGAESNEATVTITITGVNDTPFGVNDTGSVNEDSTLSVPAAGVLTNDTDVDTGTTLTVSKVNGVAGNVGTQISTVGGALVTLNANGSYTYNTNGKYESLAQGATTTDSFTYIAKDQFGAESGTTTVTITITGVNDAPVAVNDTGSVGESSVLNVGAASGVLVNDTDVDTGATRTVSKVNGLAANLGTQITLTSGALLTLNANGSYSYDTNGKFNLAAGATATDSFTYVAVDEKGAESNTATVTITITGVNDAPVAVNDTGSVSEDSKLTVAAAGVLANDTDADPGAVKTVAKVNDVAVNVGSQITLASGALLTLNANGSYVYDISNGAFNFLAQGVTTTDSFTYIAKDETGAESNKATVTITVTGSNDAPVAVNDTGAVNADSTLSVAAAGLRANDSDADSGDTFTVSTVNGSGVNVGTQFTLGSGALLTVNADGSYSYDPNGKYNFLAGGATATDSFTYQIIDNNGQLSNTATATITITGVNPVDAIDDAVVIDQPTLPNYIVTFVIDISGSMAVIVNGSQDRLEILQEALTASGGLLDTYYSLSQNLHVNLIVFHSNSNLIFDGDISNISQLDALKAQVNALSAGGGTEYTDPMVDAENEVTSDNNNPALAGYINKLYFITDGDPNTNPFYGDWQNFLTNESVDSIVVAISSDVGTGFTDPLANPTDSPRTIQVEDDLSDLNDTLLETIEYSNTVITNDTLGPNLPTTVTAFTYNNGGNTGTVGTEITTLNGARFDIESDGTYTFSIPAGGYSTDIDEYFTYTITDAFGHSDTAELHIHVGGDNTVPTAVADTATVGESGTLTVAAPGVKTNDLDDDVGSVLTVARFNGTLANVGTTLTLGSGALAKLNADGSYTYNPNGKFESLALGATTTDSFTYAVRDELGALSNTATVTITITGENDAPVAVNDTASVNEDSALTVPAAGVLANDTDIDTGDTRTVSRVNGLVASVGNQITLTSGALLTLNANGSYTYDTNGKFDSLVQGATTVDSFTYVAKDNNGLESNTATVVITITGVNDAPVAVDDTGSVGENGTLSVAAAGVLANDTDKDAGATRTVSQVNGSAANVGASITLTSGALLTLNANGSYTYNPNGKFESLGQGVTTTDSFTYIAKDDKGVESNTATVTITITGANDAPIANDDTKTVAEDSGLTSVAAAAGVLSNDTDPDSGDSLVVSAIAGGTVGSAMTLSGGGLFTLFADGHYDFDTNNAYNSLGVGATKVETITYTASDSKGGTDTATLSITVTGQNDAPIAVDDIGATFADSSVTVGKGAGLLFNDSDPDAGDTFTVSIVDGQSGVVGTQITLTSGALLTVNADGSYSYDPNGKFALKGGDTATDTFTYRNIDNNGALSNTATATMTITGVNPLAAQDDTHNIVREENTVTFVLDLSGSMGNSPTSRLGVLKSILTSTGGLLDTLYNSSGLFNVNILTFNDVTTNIFEGGVNSGTGLSSLKAQINALTSAGNTNYKLAMTDAEAMVDADTTNPVSASFNNILYWISDGSPILAQHIPNATDYANWQTFLTRDEVDSIVISVTTDVDTKYSDPLANPTDNPLTIVVADDLSNFFTQLINTFQFEGDVITNDTIGTNLPVTVTSFTYDGGTTGTIGTTVSTAAGGQFNLKADGTYTYIIEDNKSASDSDDYIIYTITDSLGNTDTAILHLHVEGSPFVPDVIGDTGTTNEDTVLNQTTSLLANDKSDDGTAILSLSTVNGSAANIGTQITLTSGALLTVNADGTYSYNPNGKFEALRATSGSDSFLYSIKDQYGHESSNGTVKITITGVNDAPVAVNDSYTTDENTTLTTSSARDLNLNDTDVDSAINALLVASINGTTISTTTLFTLSSGALLSALTSGQFQYNPNGKFDYLNTGETATDTFTYQAKDSGTPILTSANTATVTITITGANDAPVAVNDSGSTNGDTQLSVNAASGLLINDSDKDASSSFNVSVVDGQSGKVGSQITLTSGALLTVNADGSYTYDPNGKFNSIQVGKTTTDSFTYQTIDNAGLLSNTATATITINGTNPVDAVNDSATMNRASNPNIILSLVLDISSSMTSVDIDPGTAGTQTRFDAMAAAITGAQGLLDNYYAQTEGLYVVLFPFDDLGNFHWEGFIDDVTDLNNLKSMIQNLAISSNDESNYVSHMNYVNTILTPMDSIGSLGGFDHELYWLVDGDPTAVITKGGTGIPTSGDYTFWQDFLDDENVDANIVSLSSGVDTGKYTDPLANPTDSPETLTTLDTLTDLSSVLAGTLFNTGVTKGNLISNDTQGPNTPVTISAFTYDATVMGGGTNGTLGVTITTATGGTITINASGTYTYHLPVNDKNLGFDEYFTYTLTDNNGYSDSAILHIHVNGIPPIVLDLDGNNQIELIGLEDSQARFDVYGDSAKEKIAWVGPNDGLLVYDFQGDGQVTDIREFSFAQYLPGAMSDLEGLSVFDTNHDGKLDGGDQEFSKFNVWQDINSNAVVDQGEMLSLAERHIVNLSLESDGQTKEIEGNLITGYTRYETSDGQSHLAADTNLQVEYKVEVIQSGEVIHDQSQLDLSNVPSATTEHNPAVVVDSADPSQQSAANVVESSNDIAGTMATAESDHIARQLENPEQHNPTGSAAG